MSESGLSDNFTRIADLPRESREAALHELASTDPKMAEEIRSLLDHEPASRDEDPVLIETFDPAAPSESGRDSRLRIPGFKLLEPLAFGGQSVVYLAEQLHPRRMVAIKILGGGMTDDRAHERFIAEAELQGTIRHPAIVGIHACGVEVEDGRATPWIAMELVPKARTITQASTEEDWTREERLQALATVADAIHAAHLRGVVHRDLKPGNILVGAGGRVRIIDFGIARLLDAADRDSVTREGELLGTIRYLAPEQLSGSDIDARADIYSLGVLACELLHGASPYGDRSTTASIIAAIQANEIELPEARNRTTRDSNAVLSRAMAISPRSRYESMAAFARDLRSLATGQRVEARTATAAEEFRRFALRNPLSVGLTVLLFIAIVGGLIARNRLEATALELGRNARAAETRASAARTRELLSIASAAVLQNDESLARRLLDDIESDDYPFARGLLESAAGTHPSSLRDFRDRSNLYAMSSVNGTSHVVVAGGASLGMLDGDTGEETTYTGSIEGFQEQVGPRVEIEVIEVDPGSTDDLVRVAAGTNGGRILIISMTGDGDGTFEKPALLEVIDTEGSKAIAPTFLSQGRIAHGLGIDGIRVAALDGNGSPSAEPVEIRVGSEISAICAIDMDSILVGRRDGRVHVVDVVTGEVGDRIDIGFRTPIDRIVTGPRGARCVVISGRKARLLETDSITLENGGKPDAVVHELTGSRDRVWNAAFDPKGNIVAITGRDGNIRFFSTSDATPLGRLPDLDGCGWSLVWTEDALLASTESNGVVRYTLRNHPILDVQSRVHGFSPSGRRELQIRSEGWSVTRQSSPYHGQWIPGVDGEILAASVADTVSEDPGALLAVALVADRGLIGIDRSNRTHLLAPADRILDIRDLALARDGRTIIWIDGAGEVRRGVHQPGTGRSIDAWETIKVPAYSRHEGRLLEDVHTPCLSLIRPVDPLEGEDILLGTAIGTLRRLNSDLDIKRITSPQVGWLLSYAEAADDTGDWFAGGHNGDVVRHGTISWGLNTRRTSIIGLAVHPDGRHLAVLGSAGTIDIVDARLGERICTIGPVPGEPVSISIDENGQSLKVHARDGSTHRWGTNIGSDYVAGVRD